MALHICIFGNCNCNSVRIYALTPGIKPNPGHSISELAPPSSCTADQFLKFNGTDWYCSSISHATPMYKVHQACIYDLNNVSNLTLLDQCAKDVLCTNPCPTGSDVAYCGNCVDTIVYGQLWKACMCRYRNTLLGYLVN